MKVLHVISDLGPGGAPAVLASLVLADAHNEHVVISLMDLDVFGALMQQGGIVVIALDMPRGFFTRAGWRRLRQTMRDEQPDIVQTWMYHSDLIGGLAARSVGHRALCWGIHNSDLSRERTPWRSRWVAKACALLSSRVPSRIISCSTQAAGVHRAAGYDASRLRTVHNGYDLARFRIDPEARSSTRAELGVDESTLLVGMIARWHPIKDHATLFAALARFPDVLDVQPGAASWVLLLAGSGMHAANQSLLDALQRHGLQDRVKLLGERQDIERVLASLDLHVLSSAGEAFPNALAEAMACGVPCVTTDVGDAALIIDNASLVVPSGDPAALRAVIESQLLQVLQARRDGALQVLRESLHRSIEQRFSCAAMVAGYSDVWREANQAQA